MFVCGFQVGVLFIICSVDAMEEDDSELEWYNNGVTLYDYLVFACHHYLKSCFSKVAIRYTLAVSTICFCHWICCYVVFCLCGTTDDK